MKPACFVVPLLAIIAVLGIGGVALIVIGVIKRAAAMWIVGIAAILLACVVLAVVGLLSLRLVSHHAGSMHNVMRAAPGGEGDYVRSEGQQTVARIEGVHFTVLATGGGSTSISTRSSSSFPGKSTARHEVKFADVTIVVERDGNRLVFSVNGTDYGAIHRGQTVLINESRKVFVDGERR